jgi:hypothetical protein
MSAITQKRVIKAEERIPQIPEKLFLFRSCTGSMEYPGTEHCVEFVLKNPDIEPGSG